LPRGGRSRKRQRSKTQNDNEPKVKKVRKIEQESLEIEPIDDNVELQPVSTLWFYSIFCIYSCYLNIYQI